MGLYWIPNILSEAYSIIKIYKFLLFRKPLIIVLTVIEFENKRVRAPEELTREGDNGVREGVKINIENLYPPSKGR